MSSKKLNRTHYRFTTSSIGDLHQFNKHARAIPANARLIDGRLVRHGWLLHEEGSNSGPLFFDKAKALARQEVEGGCLALVIA